MINRYDEIKKEITRKTTGKGGKLIDFDILEQAISELQENRAAYRSASLLPRPISSLIKPVDELFNPYHRDAGTLQPILLGVTSGLSVVMFGFVALKAAGIIALSLAIKPIVKELNEHNFRKTEANTEGFLELLKENRAAIEDCYKYGDTQASQENQGASRNAHDEAIHVLASDPKVLEYYNGIRRDMKREERRKKNGAKIKQPGLAH